MMGQEGPAGDADLQQTEDQALMHLGEDREAFLVGQEDAGGQYCCFDWLPQPAVNDVIGWQIWTHLQS